MEPVVFEMASGKCRDMFAKLTKSPEWMVARYSYNYLLLTQKSAAFRGMYSFLRVLDTVPEFPMSDMLVSILTLTPEAFTLHRELEILRIQSKWHSHKTDNASSAPSTKEDTELLTMTNELLYKLRDFQRPDNSNLQVQLCITLRDLLQLKTELEAGLNKL